MGLNFLGGERIQRGRGIGGLLKTVSKLFFPISTLAKKALKSESGKKILNAVKDQAVESTVNVVKDIAGGKNVKESLKEEFQNVKSNAKRRAIDIGIDILKGKQAKRARKSKNFPRRSKHNGLRKKGDIFD